MAFPLLHLNAQTEPLGRQPYDLQLVALLGDHRFLAAETFQDQFPRDLAQQTKLALGELVRVEVTATHGLAEAIRRDGLGAALDAFDEVSTRRTWFFVVRFHDGQFHLQGRFFDGLTGLAGPPARTATTGDRGRLAPLAARMIAESFPLVGTVTSAKGDAVELTLHGGQLGDVGSVPRGTAFAVSRIAPEAGKLRATRLPWAALEAKSAPTAGVVPCQFWCRFRESAIVRGDGVVYRALVLPTRSAPLKVQVIDQETSRPLAGIGVKVSGGERDFDLVTDASGRAATPANVAGLALVKLSKGGADFAHFPIAIVDERPVVCAVSADPAADDLTGLDIRRQQLRFKILTTLQVADQRFGEQGVLIQQSLERSLEYAQKTVEFLDREIADIRAESEAIRRLAKPGSGLEIGGKGLERLRQLRETVRESTKRIEGMIEDRNRQTERHNLGMKFVEQAALLESQALFDEAIEAYAKAVETLPVPGKVADKLASLRLAWEIKDGDHEQARKFLVKTWPRVDANLLPEHLAMVEKSLEVCAKVDDRLTPRRFLAANVDHLAHIAQIVAKLHRSRTADDRAKLKSWTTAVETLQRLSIRASEQIAATAEKKP